MGGENERWDWHDQRGVTWAAGAAAVALIALLVVAVIRTSTSSHVPGVPSTESSGVTSSRFAGTTASSTSYSVPRVQTSDLNGPPSVSASPTDGAPPAEPETPTTSTTTVNPYLTTTTSNAGAV